MDFIFNSGDVRLKGGQGRFLRDESKRLLRYFLASVAIPEKELWVNLSPYEKDRIIPEVLGRTEMGRDLLSQDYVLKQMTASLLSPEGGAGREFWARVYDEARKRYGTTDIPVDTFNKVWIVPERAEVYEHKDAAFVVQSKLKVMLDSDYVALSKKPFPARGHVPLNVDELQGNVSPGTLPTPLGSNLKASQVNRPSTNSLENDIAKDVLRDIIIPILEKEVNEGENFSLLRQVYHSLILATWYKRKVKETLLGRAYADRQRIAGIDTGDQAEAEKIWQRYVEAFRKGAYNFIREEYDPQTHETVPRKYFSGGVSMYGAYSLSDKLLTIPLERLPVQAMASSSRDWAMRVDLRVPRYSKRGIFEAARRNQAAEPAKPKPVVIEEKKDVPGEWWKKIQGRSVSKELVEVRPQDWRQQVESLWTVQRFEHLIAADYERDALEKHVANTVDILTRNVVLRAEELSQYLDILAGLFSLAGVYIREEDLSDIVSGSPSLDAIRFLNDEVERARQVVAPMMLLGYVSEMVLLARTSDEITQAVTAVMRIYQQMGPAQPVKVRKELMNILGQVPTLEFFNVAVSGSADINDSRGEFSLPLLANQNMLLLGEPTIAEYRAIQDHLKYLWRIEDEASKAVILSQNRMWPKWQDLRKGKGTGLGGFVYLALTSKPTPLQIHELMVESRDVPGTTVSRLDQNRVDAYVFSVLHGSHDFIHDQVAGVHETMKAWLEYYESDGQIMRPRPAHVTGYVSWPPAEEDFVTFGSPYYKFDVMAALNSEVQLPSMSKREKVIDMIRRLERNTAPILEKPPRVADARSKTGYLALDKALQALAGSSSLTRTDTLDLLYALLEANKVLKELEDSRDIGVMPNLILALGWLENKAFSALREVRESRFADDLMESLVRTPWFKAAVEFMFRIHTPSWHVFNVWGEHWDELPPKEICSILANRAFRLSYEWSQLYRVKGREHLTKLLWSGNLLDAVIMLNNDFSWPEFKLDRMTRPKLEEDLYIWGESGASTADPGQAETLSPERKTFDKGGIDLDMENAAFSVSRNGTGEGFVFDPAGVQDPGGVEGLIPVIRGIMPLSAVPDFMGLN
jgi:hypothetical protein